MHPFHKKFADRTKEVFNSRYDEPAPEELAAFRAQLEGLNKGIHKKTFFYRSASLAALFLAFIISFLLYFNQEQTPVFPEAEHTPLLSEAPQDYLPSPLQVPDVFYDDEDSLPQTASDTSKAEPADTRPDSDHELAERPAALEADSKRISRIDRLSGISPLADEPTGIVATTYLRPFSEFLSVLPVSGVITDRSERMLLLPADERQTVVQETIPRTESPLVNRRTDFMLGSAITTVPAETGTGIGISAGATHSARLAGRFFLETGGLLSYTSITVDGIREFNQQLNTFVQLGSGDFTAPTQEEHQMLTLDIPLNVRFNLLSGDYGRVNLTTGLSSLVYLQQNFRDQNTQMSISSSGNGSGGISGDAEISVRTEAEFETTQQRGAFQRFEPLQLFNLALGYQLPGTRDRLSAELYMKYPLRALGEREQEITTFGLALRYGL